MLNIAVATSEPSIRVRSPVGMARLLLCASPDCAINHACMAYDRACDGDDDGAVRFWDAVIRLLPSGSTLDDGRA